MSLEKNLANKLGGNAKVTVFENGTINGAGVCRQFTPGNNIRTLADAEIPIGTFSMMATAFI